MPDCDLQTDTGPAIAPGCAGAALIAKVLALLEPQELYVLTVIFPVPVKPLPKFTLIELP